MKEKYDANKHMVPERKAKYFKNACISAIAISGSCISFLIGYGNTNLSTQIMRIEFYAQVVFGFLLFNAILGSMIEDWALFTIKNKGKR